MAPEALKHYASLHQQLCQQVCAGGQDTLTVIVNARLMMQAPGQVTPTNILVSGHFIILCQSSAAYPLKCRSIAHVPV
jgi:hypothetical protein